MNNKLNTSFFLFSFVLCFLNLLSLTSEGRPDPAPYRKYLNSDSPHDQSVINIGNALNYAQDYMEEYGIVTISTPILTSAKGNEFFFGLSNGAAFYFNDAKTNIEGKAAGFNQSFQTFQGSAQAQVDPTQVAAYAFQVKNFLAQQSAYQLGQQAAQQAANLNLSAALTQAATNASPAAQQQAEAAAWATYAAAQTNVAPTFPVASTFNSNSLANVNLPLVSTLNTSNVAQAMAMQGFQGLLNNIGSGLALDDRSALLTAAGDQEIENFFRAIGDPTKFQDFLNSEIYFGVFTVSVDPGWRTRKGRWAGKVDVNAKLEFKDARRETVLRILNDPKWPLEVRARIARDYGYDDPACPKDREMQAMQAVGITRAQEISQASPVRTFGQVPYSFQCKTMFKPIQVMVISPMVESETFDLASSYRAQSEFSLMLSALLTYSGVTGAAKAFEDYAKLEQSDIATVSSLDMVNAFSGQDGTFGFEIGPQPQAIANPAGYSSKAGNVLERQTFPALLAFTMSMGDIEPRVLYTNNAFRVYEPYISLSQTPNWVPIKEPSYMYYQHAEESQKLAWADELETASRSTNIANLNWHTHTGISGDSSLEDVLQARINRYEDALLGTINYLTLPQDHMVPVADVAPETPYVTNVIPSSVILHSGPNSIVAPETINFVLQGGNLDNVASRVKTVYSNGPVAKILFKSSSELVVRQTITSGSQPLIFLLSLAGCPPKPAAYSPTITINSTLSLPQVLDVEPRQVTVIAQTNNPPGTTNVSIFLIGSGLSRVDTNTDAPNAAKVASGYATLNQIQKLGDSLQASLQVTNVSQAISLLLPVPNWPQPGETNSILSQPIQVNLETSSKSSAATSTNQVNSTNLITKISITTTTQPHGWFWTRNPATNVTTTTTNFSITTSALNH